MFNKKESPEELLARRMAARGNVPHRGTQAKWKPPDDMPKYIVERVLKGKICGVRLKPGEFGRSPASRFCQAEPVAGQAAYNRPVPHRCARHGGAAVGPPMGNQQSKTHGFYCTALLPGEESLAPIENDLAEEIRMTKIRLRRAYEEEKRQIEALESDDPKVWERMLKPAEIRRVEQLGGDSSFVRDEVVNKIRRAEEFVHTLISQLVRLVQQQTILTGGTGDLSPQQRAQMAREFLREARRDADDTEAEEDQ